MQACLLVVLAAAARAPALSAVALGAEERLQVLRGSSTATHPYRARRSAVRTDCSLGALIPARPPAGSSRARLRDRSRRQARVERARAAPRRRRPAPGP